MRAFLYAATPQRIYTMKTLFLDVECYTNYFLVSFTDAKLSKVINLELYKDQPLNRQRLQKYMQDFTTVSFNGLSYDLPMISAALKGYNNKQLKGISDALILSKKPSWMVCKEIDLNVIKCDHIDIINVAPGQASLKIYGGRLHTRQMQDLPYDPSDTITAPMREQLRTYCRNDLQQTIELYQSLTKQIDLRVAMGQQYGVDLRSKSDAQIAESVLRSELTQSGVIVKKNEIKPGTQFKYKVPDFIQFTSPTLRKVLQAVKNTRFTVEPSGQVKLPDDINKPIKFAGATYKFGIGGLHSQEKKQAIVCGDDELLYEADFASFYPFIILGERFYPKHLTPKFLDVYGDIVKRRITAKQSGDKVTADSLKITINGSFGKLGSKYSFLYSPDLLIQTTITGQLCLLMLIEAVHAVGASVISANTDGIVIHAKKRQYDAISGVLFEFELASGYTLEETFYKAIYSRDVNNYVAVKTDGGVKGKGAFADPNIMKNPTNEICIDAVKQYMATGTPIEQTINDCNDIRKFINIRSVTGGAVWNDVYLGKAVRFYYSTQGNTIHYKKNGNKVPKSDGAHQLMCLDDAPVGLDKQAYIDEAQSMLVDLGVDNG